MLYTGAGEALLRSDDSGGSSKDGPEHEPPTRFRNRTPELLRRLDPLGDDDLDVRYRFLVSRTIRRASRQLRHFSSVKPWAG